MRGTNGRIELYGAHINNRPDEVIKFNNMLKKMPLKAKRILGKGDRYICPLNLLTTKKEKIN